MTRIENKEGVSKIVMRPIVYCLCDLGGDWYSLEIEIEMKPVGAYPDYMEVQDFLMRCVDGKRLNIEEALLITKKELEIWFPDAEIVVKGVVKNAKTHFDVEVTL